MFSPQYCLNSILQIDNIVFLFSFSLKYFPIRRNSYTVSSDIYAIIPLHPYRIGSKTPQIPKCVDA